MTSDPSCRRISRIQTMATRATLRATITETGMGQAVHLLLGAFFWKCGYTHWWHRDPSSGMEFYPLEVCLASKQPVSLYKYGITHVDIVYLAGPNSPYKRYGTTNQPE